MKLLERLDQSKSLLNFLENFSNFLAKRRGLPIVIGIALVAVGFIFQAVGVYSTSKIVELIAVITHNLGVLIALIGLVLSNPLGKT